MKLIYMQRTVSILSDKEWEKIKHEKNVKSFNGESYLVIENK